MNTYAVYWNLGAITPDLVQQAIATYRHKFSQSPAVIIAGAHRAAEAQAVGAACGLDVQLSGGLLAGEFWLGGGERQPPQQLTLGGM